MKVAGLFAGIGGFEHGLALAGHETAMTCEIWEPARAVLQSRMPNVVCERDICDLKGLPTEANLLVAGFPCQDLSQAGLTSGIAGERSGLVGEIFRLLDRQKIDWVILENVSFMLKLNNGLAMQVIIDAFEQRGYRWAYRVINSLAFLPQRRERVIFIATLTQLSPADILLTDEVAPEPASTDLNRFAHGFYWTEGVRGLGWAPNAIPTLKNGSTVGIASPPAILLPTGEIVTPDIRDAERLQGFAENWTIAAEAVGRPSLRWSLVGNAVSVPVAKWLGEKLLSPKPYNKARDGEFAANGRLPRAARFDGNTRFSVTINEYPIWQERPALHDFLFYQGKPLSARATKGFLSRTDRAKLRFAEGFRDRVRNHLNYMENLDLSKSQSYKVAAE